jgi:hypothetical protein
MCFTDAVGGSATAKLSKGIEKNTSGMFNWHTVIFFNVWR